ncbi:cell division protein FtsL [Vulcaniibacterium thermophilum]|jgi:cell division protein FtsL|uniref:Cell division protein FtsL n=1 Tax=Vulcaniibacterium thermophilum TaxID=1169913 RepID=A0A919DCR7_9GAMM|nr:cell division protein FtsL [Vulcaniibacterium thermophilum]GHE33290.1 cell division protein FtsL [Vulcaniibacterium thermophilum]
MSLRLLLTLLVVANIVSALGVVYSRHQHRLLFVQLTRLEKQRDELNIEFGRLQLEQATWAEANRIDQVARERLGMKFPEAGEIVVVRP